MTRTADVVIVGGGLVGLSTAMHLQRLQPGVAVTLIEKDSSIAMQQSGHNSGVLHAGIYYEPGSLKARFCVEGNRQLGDFCGRHGIPLIRCGKVIVANSEDEISRLEMLARRGTQNGVPGLRLIDAAELADIEPHVCGHRALYAPESAIVDYAHVARVYADRFRESGGTILLDTSLVSASKEGSRQRLVTTAGDLSARLVINCAGLHADVVARKTGARPRLRIIPFRGEFYSLVPQRRSLVRGLIYPVPNPALPFLDVHFTPRVDGSVDAGPNAVLALKREGYRWRDVSLRDMYATFSYKGFWRLAAREFAPGLAEINRSLRKSVFVRSLQRLVPEISAHNLVRGTSGVRAQAVDNLGNLLDDFHIDEVDGAIHVLNAPSPAATSSLLIGKHVANMANLRITAAGLSG